MRLQNVLQNHRVIKGKTNVVQTWIIDLYYDLVVTENYGEKDISKDETIYLITLYNDYCNVRDKKLSKKDILLFVYGFFGEQKDWIIYLVKNTLTIHLA